MNSDAIAPVLLRTDAAGVATLTLNRPDKLNALNAELFEALHAQVLALRTQTETIGCVVLTGAGRAFCAGGDLEMVRSGPSTPQAIHFRAGVVTALAELPQPVIAAINGPCFAGGLELALAADLLIAADTAIFADVHARIGGTPRWGLSVRLPRRIGAAAAKDLMWSGRRISAAEALQLGLVQRVAPAAELATHTQTWAQAILANAWHVVQGIKHLIDHQVDQPMAEGLAYELALPQAKPATS